MPITINGSGTITGISAGGLPDAIITQPDLAAGVAGNGPAFSAYQSSPQTFSNATYTKILFQTEEFDTNNNFDSTTNYRFTPTVAGYYQLSGGMNINGSSTAVQVIVYKNGSTFKFLFNGTTAGIYGSTLIYLNGSTDYVELYGYMGVGQQLSAASSLTYFQGFLARAA